ncbi:hypothetical protein ACFV9P_19840 [Streptomyces sp. NPDC059892]
MIVLPEGGPYAGAGVVDRMADIVIPAATCEIVYEVPVLPVSN